MNAIEIKNLTKEYKLYKNDKDRLKDLFGGDRCKRYKALDDVNINLPKGAVIGILGKNGSGKSTLLKMVTGVVYPTSGELIVNGKVSALLELAAGFDGELTGRDNIYLKGYGLGLTKDFIEMKLDEIIEFAELGDYIDQPVRMYSSGMKSRLGFAISVNVNPDILVIDEALAVGDELFRAKCMRKMNEIRELGVTILFVSHSIGQIKSFCTHGMWLHEGKMLYYGEIEDAAKLYEHYLKGVSVETIMKNPDKYKNMLEIKQNISNTLFKDGTMILSGSIWLNKVIPINVKYVKIHNETKEYHITVTKQEQVNDMKINYEVNVENEMIEAGAYKMRVYFEINNTLHHRELWSLNQTGHFQDVKSGIDVKIVKNRFTLTKK